MNLPEQQAPRPHILVVEDDPTLRRMLGKMLAQIGEISEASNGAEALRKLDPKAKPDVVVTDLMMPTLDGITLCRTMKRDARYAHIPVIILTAKGSSKEREEGNAAGAFAYLIKPFRHHELLDAVQRALGSVNNPS